jgi:hypothetical protein
MELREQRGLELAATRKIHQKDGVWFVPSQTSDGTKYKVIIRTKVATCTCPDHETRGAAWRSEDVLRIHHLHS